MFSLSLQQLLLFLSLTLHSSYQAVHNHRPSKEVSSACLNISELLLQCQSTSPVFPNSHLQSGERMSDGAFSPRDHKHGSGEEHDNSFDHEAILGSRKDAEEYDDLPPEEAKRRLGVSLGCSEFSPSLYFCLPGAAWENGPQLG